jgi:phage baseplate assembly protein W
MQDPIEAFQFPIRVDAARGVVKKETRFANYVNQLIRQVLLTSPGERIDRPDFGCGLRRMVFSPVSDATATLLQTTVFQNLDRWLGSLIRIDDVVVTAGDARIDVTINYTIKSRGDQEVLNLEVTD